MTLDALTSNEKDIKNFINETIEVDQYKSCALAERIKEDPNFAETFEDINLHNCELSLVSQSLFKSFRSVQKLVLSFNNLTTLKDICYLVSI